MGKAQSTLLIFTPSDLQIAWRAAMMISSEATRWLGYVLGALPCIEQPLNTHLKHTCLVLIICLVHRCTMLSQQQLPESAAALPA